MGTMLSQHVQIMYMNYHRHDTTVADQSTIFLGQMKKGEDEATSSKPNRRVNRIFGDIHDIALTSATKIARLSLKIFSIEAMNKKGDGVKALKMRT